MPLYREQGLVLRTYKLGEADRILNVLTQGRGKVRAVAKGVRRPGSRFGGRLEPFSHVELQLYGGRSLDIVTQAELVTPFSTVREDYVLSACASTMVEAADRVAQEDERNLPLFVLLLDGLRALSSHPPHPGLVLDAYLLRLAAVAGYHPYLEACASCGAPGRHRVLGIAAGGVVCDRCAPAGAQPLAEAVLSALAGLITTPWSVVGHEPGDPAVRRSVAALVNSYLTYHLGRPLASWELVPR